MHFEYKIRKIIEKECEDYFLGIADLSLSDNPLIHQYDPLIANYPRAISVGITLPYNISEELLRKSERIYRETNCKLKSITAHLSSLLENEGYRALSFPKSNSIKDDTFVSLHKIFANMANLGQIKGNGLFVTPEVGSGVKWGTVLTNAFL